jgi:hypothetical protein
MKTPLLVLFTLALLPACDSGANRSGAVAQPPVGQMVTVQFRRDALGGAANLPVSPTTNSVDGAKVSLSGHLTEANQEWLVIRTAAGEHWIARDSVLLVSVP